LITSVRLRAPNLWSYHSGVVQAKLLGRVPSALSATFGSS